MTRDDWFWLRMPGRYMVHGERAGRILNARAVARNLNRHGFTFDGRRTPLENDIVGMQSEIAYYLFAGRPVPSVEALVDTWDGPDVDDIQIKHVTQLPRPDCGMALTAKQRAAPGVNRYILILAGARPRFALVGEISCARAWSARIDPPPQWRQPGKIIVPWPAFRPYQGPLDRAYLDPMLRR